MYVDNIEEFSKNDYKLETLIPAIRIYSQNRGMEFSIEMKIMHHAKNKKVRKDQQRKE